MSLGVRMVGRVVKSIHGIRVAIEETSHSNVANQPLFLHPTTDRNGLIRWQVLVLLQPVQGIRCKEAIDVDSQPYLVRSGVNTLAHLRT